MTPYPCFPSLLLGVWMLSCAQPLPGMGRGEWAASGADGARGGALESSPLAAPGVGGGARFTSLAPAATGIEFRSFLKRPHHIPFLNTGAGVAVGDVDGDGWSDVYLLSTDSRNRLYRQVTPWRFEDVTERAGVDGGDAWSRGATFADVDNDGDLDLYVTNTEAPNLLYLNRGDGRFDEAASRFGLDHSAASIMAYFADYDRDGDLDVYLVTYRALKHNLTEDQIADIEIPAATLKGRDELRVQPVRTRRERGKVVSADREQWIDLGSRDWELAGQIDRLLRNDGTTFTDVTEAAGLLDYGLGLAATWMDFDGDGWLDLHVGNDLNTRDRLYRNNRDGTFTDVLPEMLPHTTWYSMGADFADVDNDGRFDFLVADMAGSTHYRAKVGMGDMSSQRWFMTHEWPRQLMRNSLYLNTGSGRYQEVAHLAGVAATDWTWAVKLGDLDNDGRVDLFVTNGTARDDMNIDLMGIEYLRIAEEEGEAAAQEYLKTIPTAPTPNLAFRNLGDLRFESAGTTWGLDHDGISYGAAFADLDRDGDLDLVVNHLGEAAGVYRNDGTDGQRLLVALRGTVSNRFGFGGTVTVRADASGTQVRQLLPARGFMSSDEPVLHFGLGRDTTVRELAVAWPSGHRQSFTDLPAGHLHIITEPAGAAPPAELAAPTERQFEEVSRRAGLDWTHLELPFDDYAAQPLLPAKLSQLGPGVAWGDADGDGRDDLFVAGAARQPGGLYLNRGSTFERRAGGPWVADAASEDMAPLWFDFDRDGDLDLYISSGSVQSPEGDPRLRDRLYLNDGRGGFAPAPAGSLPPVAASSGVVAAADFDADGDLDLFVGSRSVPGKYPLTPASHLLVNDGGRLRDATAELAPGLARVGLVTGALWSDADGDGDGDLLVTLEWGPVKFFRNASGRLEDRTREAGLSERLGWWSSITGGDFNADGAIDYAVMNLGLNSKYHASPTRPARLYVGDMDASGEMDLIEAKSGDEGLLPIRGRSCSALAMPFVGEKFHTFHDFASATLPEIYSTSRLESSLELMATELASGILENDGAARFTWRPLPRRAQTSPGYGAAAADFDGDGRTDLYAAQNLFTREPETGPLDGGLSVLLLGDGRGGFRVASPADTGLLVAGDGKGLGVADFDGDGWPDVVVSQNNDALLAFRNRGVPGRRPFAVRLRGRPGNPAAVGARVSLVGAGGERQTAEVYAGSGYLSQSSPTLFFGLGEAESPVAVEVRWPGGEHTRHPPEPGSSRLLIEAPAAAGPAP